MPNAARRRIPPPNDGQCCPVLKYWGPAFEYCLERICYDREACCRSRFCEGPFWRLILYGIRRFSGLASKHSCDIDWRLGSSHLTVQLYSGGFWTGDQEKTADSEATGMLGTGVKMLEGMCRGYICPKRRSRCFIASIGIPIPALEVNPGGSAVNQSVSASVSDVNFCMTADLVKLHILKRV